LYTPALVAVNMNFPKREVMRYVQFAIGKMIPFRLKNLTTIVGLM